MKMIVGLLFTVCLLISFTEGYNDDALNEIKSGLFIEHTFQEITGSQVSFNIAITNSCDVKIQEIGVAETLPASMKYLPGSSYLSPNEAVFKEPKPIDNPDGTTTLTWSIGNLTSDQSKTIQFTAAAVEPSEAKNSIVTASGSALGTSIVTPTKNAKVDIGSLG